ncbi:hypothetical protein K491DRAFT_668475 [Lophiostoma macrostomum CBS 122681]|uniref:EthD domain-containing protein n=1 Tax=Lophiostoma macrostomum CBS 122681 TaxID=1314788 RepID=A0A6A6SPZ5_9PLEO|nr:hypothetical protein K491DRAFT_668475 [Lophiostoma macrostomum CBS 122681]
MPYAIALFVSRKPGVSIGEFKDHWENKHIPLLKSIVGKAFPLTHTRRYVARVESGAGDRAGVTPASHRRAPSAAPVVLGGDKNEVTWDGFAELVFRDELHFQQFFALVNESEAAARIQQDEERFADASNFKVVVIGETICTRND